MLKKKKIVQSVQTSPDKFQAQDAIERIELLEKIRIGIQQSENGKVVSKEQVEKRLKKWLK